MQTFHPPPGSAPGPRLVAIAGRKESGKTTLAKRLVGHCPAFRRVGFADAVKDVCYSLWGGDFLHHYHGSGKNALSACGWTYRELMQKIGTDVARDIDPNVWVNKLFRDWEDDGRPWLVIDDLRFPNEAAAVRARGGVVLLLERGVTQDAHVSESYFDALEHDLKVPDMSEELTWRFAREFLKLKGLCS